MKGCDNRCTYCVVPDARGAEVSRPAEKILEEISGLASEGFKEVTLIGQNVNSYGKGLEPEMEFPELLKSVESIDGIERIRFMTSHPKDLTGRLIDVIASSEKVSPYLHLPVQSGSNRILAAMKRGYTREEYLGKVARLREAVKGITISTDLMFGFPGESEEDHLDSIRVMEEVRFDSAYLFNYSQREGTPAARYEGQVGRDVVSGRFDSALNLNKRIILEKNKAMLGRKVVVLCEDQYNVLMEAKAVKSPGSAVISGRTPGNHVVRFDGNISLVGKTVDVEVTGDTGYDLTGRLCA
jgi:tRNA-2-methylthio-N6-dimethylallyladenosine synthase